ncbi:MAG: DUF551 domain-containing protein [Pseudomonadota bacterium]
MTIEWIGVETRVPDNRRDVMAWGVKAVAGNTWRVGFLGSTKFNLCCGGGKFDVEACGFGLMSIKVTHWAEIEGPPVTRPPRAP